MSHYQHGMHKARAHFSGTSRERILDEISNWWPLQSSACAQHAEEASGHVDALTEILRERVLRGEQICTTSTQAKSGLELTLSMLLIEIEANFRKLKSTGRSKSQF